MATLRELATAARVSIRTVNRVLKNDGYVHAETRHAVENAVQKLGYRPNLAARALKTAKSHFIAVLTFTEDELRMAQIAALEQRLRQSDYLVSMTFHFDFRQKARAIQVIQEVIGQNPAGIVLLGHDPYVARNILPALLPTVVRSRLPYVVIDPKGVRKESAHYDAVTSELHKPTKAPELPIKNKRCKGFSATNASPVKLSSPTSHSTTKRLALLLPLSRLTKNVVGDFSLSASRSNVGHGCDFCNYEVNSTSQP